VLRDASLDPHPSTAGLRLSRQNLSPPYGQGLDALKLPLGSSLVAWLWAPVGLIAFALLLTGVPEHAEGPTLVLLGSGHGFSTSNALALLLLTIGVVALCAGAWQNARTYLQVARHRLLPAWALGLELLAGTFLLIHSGLSTTLRWWAPGLVLTVTALVGLAILISLDSRPQVRAALRRRFRRIGKFV
jgi:hypothetical protein